jgi:1-aminocyclopropane-1-carboxylate deaminase/D-cysteine desulfhydrase-like pyridoxal-dependent ACC family enzyme
VEPARDCRLTRWPALGCLPRANLVSTLTPVQTLRHSPKVGSLPPLLVKRDDLCVAAFGGCKARALDLGLGAALAAGADVVLTAGTMGSNHVAATAVLGRLLGLTTRAVLLPQPANRLVRRNVRRGWTAGAEFILVPAGTSLRLDGQTMLEQARALRAVGRRPFVLPFGGSGLLSSIAQVEAALELAYQLRELRVAPPAAVYLAAATMTTAAGIVVGLRLGGLASTVVAVQVAGDVADPSLPLLTRAREVLKELRKREPTIPQLEFTRHDLELRDGRAGGSIQEPVPTAAECLRVAAQERIELDSVYTARAFSEFLRDASLTRSDSGPLLFWHTGSTRGGSVEEGERHNDVDELDPV